MFPRGGRGGKEVSALIKCLYSPLGTYLLVEENGVSFRYVSLRRWRKRRPSSHELATWFLWDSYAHVLKKNLEMV
jgi:hypothetical protein